MGGSLWKKLVDGFKAVAHVFPFSEQFIQNGGVGLGGGVQQHHRAVVGSGNKLTESLLLGGEGGRLAGRMRGSRRSGAFLFVG